MTNLITNALAARLRSIDWYYGYSDDYTVWAKEKAKIDKLKYDLSMMPIEANQEILGLLLASKDVEANSVHMIEMVIAKQLLQREQRASTGSLLA
jgi:hypothetical protein